jgi:aminoglycoside phosphotransferase (APT) family kinase protein
LAKHSLGDSIPGTGNLYAWENGQILKLYGEDVPADWVMRLGQTERALYDAGLPVPWVGETLEIDGLLGQVYERIEGETIAAIVLGATEQDAGRVEELARVFAAMHAKIHSYEPGGDLLALPQQRQLLPMVIRRLENLPAELAEATLEAFDQLPGGDRLCHGDFHPYNVLIGPRGPVVIDWNNAHIGNPLEDVARSRLMLAGATRTEPTARAVLDQFGRTYVECYSELVPEWSASEIDAWGPVVAAVRLVDGIAEIEEWLLEQIRSGLAPHD